MKIKVMKSYTDIDQSKKLSEILPLESADMYYWYGEKNVVRIGKYGYHGGGYFDIPCWSLVALLGVLPTFTIDSSDDHYYRVHCMKRYTEWYDNLVDACYEMILKLHELKLL